MRIVVTGATGNVGTAVLRRLQKQADVEIVGIARRRPDDSVPPYAGVEWHTIDIGAERADVELTEIFRGADAVINLAWLLQPNRDEPFMRRTNIGGTKAVLRAVTAAGVPQIVQASSVGAYSPGPKTRRVDESWPTGGIHTSHYSRHKAVNERVLDRFEQAHPETIVTRLRPGLIFQTDAGQEIPFLFLGPLAPVRLLAVWRPPVLPLPSRFITQAVHADDVADAYWRVVEQKAAGAFNIAADPVLDRQKLAQGFRAKRVIPFPFRLLRLLAGISWRFGLQRTDPGWLDIAALTPLMSTDRARTELGWTAARTSLDTLKELVDAMGDGRRKRGSPPLDPAGRHHKG